MKNLVKALLVVMLLVPTAALIAQETNYEVKSGTVVAVFNDQLVVKMSNGETKQVTVPAGFMFTVDGKQVGLNELTPGTNLTAVIKTTKTPETVKTTTIKNGEVIKVVGGTLVVRTEGKTKQVTVPKGFQFIVDGKKVGLDQLTPGMKLNAEIVTTSVKTVETKDVKIGGATPPKPEPVAAPAPAPAPAPEPAAAEPAKKLPKTGSHLPLAAVLGTLLLAAGVAMRRA